MHENNKRSQKGLKIDEVALNGAFWTHKKSGVQIRFKKWNPFVTDEFPYENPHTSKEIVRFVHEVHPVFAVTLSTFMHMLCGSNDDTMPIFNLFRVHLKCFSISGSFSSKQINKCMKNSKLWQKGLKVDDVDLNCASERKKSLELY